VWTTPIIGVETGDDSTHTVTVGTVDYGQAHVVLMPGVLDTPEAAEIFARVSDPAAAARTIPRRSAKQKQSPPQ
jgi:hypothetical protein